jgi:hypothetical protein
VTGRRYELRGAHLSEATHVRKYIDSSAVLRLLHTYAFRIYVHCSAITMRGTKARGEPRYVAWRQAGCECGAHGMPHGIGMPHELLYRTKI